MEIKTKKGIKIYGETDIYFFNIKIFTYTAYIGLIHYCKEIKRFAFTQSIFIDTISSITINKIYNKIRLLEKKNKRLK